MIRRLTPAEHRAKYKAERQEFADTWTEGDVEKAEAIFDSFPYCDTPSWEDVHLAVELIRNTAKGA